MTYVENNKNCGRLHQYDSEILQRARDADRDRSYEVQGVGRGNWPSPRSGEREMVDRVETIKTRARTRLGKKKKERGEVHQGCDGSCRHNIRGSGQAEGAHMRI
jgi:hypothetical protein